jgi:hypothetical protein
MEGGPHDGYHIQKKFNKACKIIAIHFNRLQHYVLHLNMFKDC